MTEKDIKKSKEGIKSFPKNIKFKYNWRKYQKRVLDELTEHLDDNHLHIIAPPGSGKTILGLEVALRLHKPTLIFAPTIAIRNQWIQRFCELFLQTNITPDWISIDIKNPKILTVATYQGLHAACSGASEKDEESNEEALDFTKPKKSTREKTDKIIKGLKNQNIGTIVVDEAHHLKNAWWQSLSELKKALNPTIVGLTATPPYDVSFAEWQRYSELNGPVDAEITIPELVVEGDLCPHQDYVFFSRPTDKETSNINKYRQRIKVLFNEIKEDQILIEALENHPIFQSPNKHLDWIYSNLQYYASTLIFLNAAGKQISTAHLEIMGDKKFFIPELNYEWLEIVLTFYLYKDYEHFKQFENHQEKLINKLKRGGAIERRAINFSHNHKINNALSSSIGKLESINKIVEFEYNHLKSDLRMVILTDYIRKEFLIQEQKNDLELNKIGVLPIFEKLRRTNNCKIKIGILSGSLVIIPASTLNAFKEISKKHNIDHVSTTPLAFDNNYLIVNSNNKLKHDIVNIVTQVFQNGHIEVLIGTKSLLGEGWDAPAINSLILASFVGSYVLSNQMRGRAIRTEQKNIDKTSTIWHLVCIDPTSKDGGDDMLLLKRRFKAFVGISIREEDSIENGINRLDIPKQITTKLQINAINNSMFNSAGKREQLKEKWRQALASGTLLIEEIKVPFPDKKNYKQLKSLYYNRTIKYLFGILGSGLVAFGFEVLQGLGRVARHVKSMEDFLYWLMIIGGLGMLIFGRLAFKTIRVYVKYRDISKDIHQIGMALLQTLINIGSIKTNISNLTVVANVDDYGAIYCHLEGGTTFEKSTFIKSLQEIIATVDNPRYVIIRKSFFLNIFSQKDYHALPDIIGRKKKFAQNFENEWRNFVGACELIYTRTLEGRKLLLKSRIQSLASEFEEKTERINKWR